MPFFICIDTATSVCSVILVKDDKVLSKKESTEDKAHASRLGVFIKQVMDEADLRIDQLDAIAVSKGPGSYTGLRIGVSTAKGLCYGAGIPLIAVETLQVMANGMLTEALETFTTGFNPDSALFCPMIDARRMEVYTALFDINNQKIRETNAIIVREDTFDSFFKNRQVVFAGDGADKCRSLLKHHNALFLEGFKHSASYMVNIAQKAYKKRSFENLAYFEPYYLKDFIATSPKRKPL
jgi:tRNA threonylcarbamoyladenosine biosynthesis protein TsaB